MAEHVQADDGIEAPGLKLELRRVRASEGRVGDALPSSFDLSRRDVDSQQTVAFGKLPGRRTAPAAPKLEQIRAVLEQVE
jgi:hypothetical protein